MGKIPTTIPRRQLGRRLRDMRLEAGLSIQDSARLIERGAGTLQRLEKGEANRIRLLDIQALCQIYDRIDQLPGLLELAKVAASGDGEHGLWWDEYGDAIRADFALYVSLEASASKLTIYRPDIISGLFQTPDYARTLDTLYFPDASPEELDRRVSVRLNRQRIITRRRNPVEVDLLLDENVLRRVVGNPKVMTGALRHIADLPANVTVSVLPFTSGYPGGVAPGPFTVLDFDRATGEPPTVYVENYTGDMYYDRPKTVFQYRDAHDARKRVALSPADSKQMLRRTAREYEQ
ncbi:helix-turn-helix domain-containing protein [Nocardia amamiensis]|uniref:helix-turn-helix domain-containing protein n=1 Tax=Nocardia amamiensis TaxID=404578 RepID=UPI00340525AB